MKGKRGQCEVGKEGRELKKGKEEDEPFLFYLTFFFSFFGRHSLSEKIKK